MMEDNRVLKREGRSLVLDKETSNNQKVLEIGTDIPEKAKVDNENKISFEDYKTLYKGAIDEKCTATYGTCDDTKLWEDTAKEMFLKSALYIPDETNTDGELVKKESKRIISHNKVTETKNSNFKVTINTPFGKMEFNQEADSQENANKLALDKVKSAFKPEYQDKVTLSESDCSKQSEELDKECPKQD